MEIGRRLETDCMCECDLAGAIVGGAGEKIRLISIIGSILQSSSQPPCRKAGAPEIRLSTTP